MQKESETPTVANGDCGSFAVSEMYHVINRKCGRGCLKMMFLNSLPSGDIAILTSPIFQFLFGEYSTEVQNFSA